MDQPPPPFPTKTIPRPQRATSSQAPTMDQPPPFPIKTNPRPQRQMHPHQYQPRPPQFPTKIANYPQQYQPRSSQVPTKIANYPQQYQMKPREPYSYKTSPSTIQDSGYSPTTPNDQIQQNRVFRSSTLTRSSVSSFKPKGGKLVYSKDELCALRDLPISHVEDANWSFRMLDFPENLIRERPHHVPWTLDAPSRYGLNNVSSSNRQDFNLFKNSQNTSKFTQAADDCEKVLRNVDGILKNLTKENLDDSLEQVLCLRIPSLTLLEDIVDLIFNKVSLKPDIKTVYVQLCKDLSEKSGVDWGFVSLAKNENGYWFWTLKKDKSHEPYYNGRDPTNNPEIGYPSIHEAREQAKKHTSFKAILLNIIQQEFGKGNLKAIQDALGKVRKKVQENPFDESLKEAELNVENKLIKMNQRVPFIGELFLKKILPSSVIKTCVIAFLGVEAIRDPEAFLKNDQNQLNLEDVECVCELLKNVGEELAQSESASLDRYFQFLEALKETRRLDARLHDMVMSLIHLRNQSWTIRKEPGNVSTTDDGDDAGSNMQYRGSHGLDQRSNRYTYLNSRSDPPHPNTSSRISSTPSEGKEFPQSKQSIRDESDYRSLNVSNKNQFKEKKFGSRWYSINNNRSNQEYNSDEMKEKLDNNVINGDTELILTVIGSSVRLRGTSRLMFPDFSRAFKPGVLPVFSSSEGLWYYIDSEETNVLDSEKKNVLGPFTRREMYVFYRSQRITKDQNVKPALESYNNEDFDRITKWFPEDDSLAFLREPCNLESRRYYRWKFREGIKSEKEMKDLVDNGTITSQTTVTLIVDEAYTLDMRLAEMFPGDRERLAFQIPPVLPKAVSMWYFKFGEHDVNIYGPCRRNELRNWLFGELLDWNIYIKPACSLSSFHRINELFPNGDEVFLKDEFYEGPPMVDGFEWDAAQQNYRKVTPVPSSDS